MIRIRRVGNAVAFLRRYELQLELATVPQSEWSTRTVGRGRAVNLLTPTLGIGDAWSFVAAADTTWERGDVGWAVEFDERGR